MVADRRGVQSPAGVDRAGHASRKIRQARSHPMKVTPAPSPPSWARARRSAATCFGELCSRSCYRVPPDARARSPKKPATPSMGRPGRRRIAAAAGWAAIRSPAPSRAGNGASTSSSSWDTESDAKEAETAARKALQQLAGKTASGKANANVSAIFGERERQRGRRTPTRTGSRARTEAQVRDPMGSCGWSAARGPLLTVFAAPAGAQPCPRRSWKSWKSPRVRPIE